MCFGAPFHLHSPALNGQASHLNATQGRTLPADRSVTWHVTEITRERLLPAPRGAAESVGLLKIL